MIDGSPSQTALMVAAMRARHFLFAPEPKILRDSLAMQLGGFETPEAVAAFEEAVVSNFSLLSDRETAETFLLRLGDSVCMRSRLVEGQIEAGISGGLKQLIILGAGLDSTAYRCTELTKDLQIFEVDHPSTQTWKRKRLEEIGVDIPDNLRFVSFDFENQTLAEALMAGGVDMNAVSLFSWLGVHMYLTDATVKSTLGVLGGFPAGSELVMDFVQPDYSGQDDIVDDGLKQLAEMVAAMGEQFKSLYTLEQLEQRLRSAGFSDVIFHSRDALVDRFLDGNQDAYSIPGDGVSILSARV